MTSHDFASSYLHNVRLEELLRLLQIKKEISNKRQEKFYSKLEELKERQEAVQQRRCARLRKQGFFIDIAAVKERAKNGPHWFDGRSEEQQNMQTIHNQIHDMLQTKETHFEADVASETEYHSEVEEEDEFLSDEKNVEIEDTAHHRVAKNEIRSRSRVMSREASKLSLSKDDPGNSPKHAKSVGLKVKKHGDKKAKKGLKTAVSAVTTAKYMSKLGKKK